jgi:hypothetical protein
MERKNKIKLKKKKAKERKKNSETVKGGKGDEEEEVGVEEDDEALLEVEKKISSLCIELGMEMEYLRKKVMTSPMPIDLISSIEAALAAGALPHEIAASLNPHRSSPSPSITAPVTPVANKKPEIKNESILVFDDKLLGEPPADASNVSICI